jgi:hypothetical protein
MRLGRGRAQGLLGGAIALLASLACASSAAAQPSKLDDVIQEVFLGEAVFAQDQLELQITNGLAYARSEDEDLFADGLAVELGITDDLQIEASMAGEGRRSPEGSAAGLGNSEVGLLYGFLSDPSLGLALSTGLGVGFPAITSGVGEDAYSLELVFIAYKVLGPIHANLSLAPELVFAGDEEETTVEGGAALSLFHPVGAFVPLVELGVGLDEEGTAVALAGGLLWHPREEVEVGVSAVVGLTEASPEGGAFLNVAWEIELDDDDDE